MSGHPDLVELRQRYERAFETPQAWTAEALLLLAGLYAAISPWVVGFNSSSRGLAVNDLIVGLALAVLTLGVASVNVHLHGLTWLSPALGIWLIITPWVVQGVDRTAGVIASNVVVGACTVVLGAAVSAVALRAARRG